MNKTNSIQMALAFLLLQILVTVSAPQTIKAQEIKLTSAVTQIVETVNVPAQRSGVLKSVNVREGQVVSKNEMLGEILDDGSQLKYERARTEFAIAERAAKDDTIVRFAVKSSRSHASRTRSQRERQSIG